MHLRLANQDPRTLPAPSSDRRTIRFASEIVRLDGSSDTIGLRGVTDAESVAFVRANGAVRTADGWSVPRTDPFPFDLGTHLPRIAHRSLEAEIPCREDWCSAASVLGAAVWRRLIAETWRSQRACRDCGAFSSESARLDGLEVWTDRLRGEVLSRRLVEIALLCPSCLDAHRRPLISAPAFARLCAVNRVHASERKAFREAIVSRASLLGRERRAILDLSMLAGRRVGPSGIMADDGWIVPDGHASKRVRVEGLSGSSS